jgi:hypothetical protein
MAPPAGYVGYTVPEEVIFLTCVTDYDNPRHTPSQKGAIAAASNISSFSMFEFTVELNNQGSPLPLGKVIVAKLTYAYTAEEPCGTVRPRVNKVYYEKYSSPALDTHFHIAGCEARIINYVRTIEYAIIPDPNALVVPAGEHAVQFPGALAGLNAAQTAAFNAAVTLKIDFTYDYDGCNRTPQTPSGTRHCLDFTAVTLDPAQGPNKITWTLPGSPKRYKSRM